MGSVCSLGGLSEEKRQMVSLLIFSTKWHQRTEVRAMLSTQTRLQNTTPNLNPAFTADKVLHNASLRTSATTSSKQINIVASHC